MLLLAFDVGRTKTGIAIGNITTALARPLTTIRGTRSAQIVSIGAHIRRWQPQQLLVGLPRHMDGVEHAMTKFCRDFAAALQQHYSLPVALVDERLSTVTARTVGGDVDAVAAAIILQDWLRGHCASANSPLSAMTAADNPIVGTDAPAFAAVPGQ